MMKNGLISVATFLAFALTLLPSGSASTKDTWSDDLPEKDEFRQSYELSPGARVQVSGINGQVEIETTNGSAAEVYIVRSAKKREDLDLRKIIVEATATSLEIRSEKNSEQRGRGTSVRQRVMLKLPRQIDLGVDGVNGPVTVGELGGSARVNGVNGRVRISQAVGYAEITGVNGGVTIGIARLGEKGLTVRGVNGGIELQFADDVNADVEVHGINGSVNADLPNVTIQGKQGPNTYRMKIGSGGPRIRVDGVNGGVRLSRNAVIG
jgi:DUF4097 and DUF4098 domain-containing protein YvlB